MRTSMRILLVLLTLLLPGALKADFGIEARAAILFPTDSRIRDVYRHQWGEYGIEVFYDFCGPWEIFNDLNYSWVHGRSTCQKNRSQMSMWSNYMGVKYIYCWMDCFKPYIGLGGGVVNVEFQNNSKFVKKEIDRWGGGIIVKTGFEYYFCDCFFLDLFADYTYNWIDFDSGHKKQVCNDQDNDANSNRKCCSNSHEARTGGFKLGLGLGMEF